MSAAAAELAAHSPSEPAVLAAHIEIVNAVGAAYGEPGAAASAFAVARVFAVLANSRALDVELAAQQARTIAPPEPGRLEVRRGAQAAEEAGDFALAAHLWLDSMDGTARDGDRVLTADNALARAGNPPVLRALWHAYVAAGATLKGTVTVARDHIAQADAIVRRVATPLAVRVEEALANAEMRIGDYAHAAQRLGRVKALVLASGRRGNATLLTRTQYARALAWNDQTIAATAEIQDLLAGLDPSRRLPDKQYVAAIHLYAEIASWSDPAEALRRLDQWDRALDLTLGRDDLWRGHVEGTRALALTNLGRFVEAERSARRSLEIEIVNAGPSAATTAETRVLLGQILIELARDGEAEEQLRRGVADMAVAVAAAHPRLAQARYALAELLSRHRRYDEALPLAELALPVFEAPGSPLTAWERGGVKWVLAESLAHVAPDRTRERSLLDSAVTDLETGGDPKDVLLVAARARLRKLGR